MADGDYAHPPAHSNTEPTKSAPFNTASNPSIANGSRPSDLTAVDEKESDRTATMNSSEATTRSIPESKQNLPGEGHVPRKRLKFMGILGHPDRTGTETSDSSDLARTESGEKKKKRRKHIPAWAQFKAVMFGSWINVLLICIPIGFAAEYAPLNGYALFILNFIAIVPLAAMLSFATEELALYVGETLGGLLNASFGNATELIGTFIPLSPIHPLSNFF